MNRFKSKFNFLILILGLISPTLGKERGALRELVHKRIEKTNEQLSHIKNPVLKEFNRQLAQNSIIGLHPEAVGIIGEIPDELLAPKQNLVNYEKQKNNRVFNPDGLKSLNFRQKPDNHFLKHQQIQHYNQPQQLTTPESPKYLTPFRLITQPPTTTTTTTTRRQQIAQRLEPQRPFNQPQPQNHKQPSYTNIQIQNKPQAQIVDQNLNVKNYQQPIKQEPISFNAQIQPVQKLPEPIPNHYAQPNQFDNSLNALSASYPDQQQLYQSQISPELYQQTLLQNQLALNQPQMDTNRLQQLGQLEKFQNRKRDPNHPLFSLREKEKANLKNTANENLLLNGKRFMKAQVFKFENNTDATTTTKKPKKLTTTTTTPEYDYEEYLVEVTKTIPTTKKQMIYDDVSTHGHEHHDSINGLILHVDSQENFQQEGAHSFHKLPTTTTTSTTTASNEQLEVNEKLNKMKTLESNLDDLFNQKDTKLEDFLKSNSKVDMLINNPEFLDALIEKYGELYDE